MNDSVFWHVLMFVLLVIMDVVLRYSFEDEMNPPLDKSIKMALALSMCVVSVYLVGFYGNIFNSEIAVKIVDIAIIAQTAKVIGVVAIQYPYVQNIFDKFFHKETDKKEEKEDK